MSTNPAKTARLLVAIGLSIFGAGSTAIAQGEQIAPTIAERILTEVAWPRGDDRPPASEPIEIGPLTYVTTGELVGTSSAIELRGARLQLVDTTQLLVADDAFALSSLPTIDTLASGDPGWFNQPSGLQVLTFEVSTLPEYSGLPVGEINVAFAIPGAEVLESSPFEFDPLISASNNVSLAAVESLSSVGSGFIRAGEWIPSQGVIPVYAAFRVDGVLLAAILPSTAEDVRITVSESSNGTFEGLASAVAPVAPPDEVTVMDARWPGIDEFIASREWIDEMTIGAEEFSSGGLGGATVSGDVDADEVGSDEVGSDEVGSDEVTSDEVTSDEVGSDGDVQVDPVAGGGAAAEDLAQQDHGDEGADGVVADGENDLGDGGLEPGLILVPLAVGGLLVGYLIHRRRDASAYVGKEPESDDVGPGPRSGRRLQWPTEPVIDFNESSITAADRAAWDEAAKAWIERAIVLAVDDGAVPDVGGWVPVPAWAWERAWEGAAVDPSVTSASLLRNPIYDPRGWVLNPKVDLREADASFLEWVRNDPNDASFLVNVNTFRADYCPIVPVEELRQRLRSLVAPGREGWVPVAVRDIRTVLDHVTLRGTDIRAAAGAVSELVVSVEQHAGGHDQGMLEINASTGEVRDPQAMRIRCSPEHRQAMLASAVDDVAAL